MAHPGEKHIDPRLLEKIKQSEKDGGIFLKDVPDNHIVEAHTQNSIYAIALVDKEKGRVAVQGNNKHFIQPEVCYLRGSTFGGSMIKIGWIGVGMHLELNLTSGGILTTSSIKTVKVKEDTNKVKELVEKALAIAPQEVTREEVQDSLKKFVQDKFPVSMRTEVISIIDIFSLNGQIAIVSLLEVAYRHKKFDAAKQLINKFFREHWGYQAPEVRGDPDFTQKNAWYIEQAYKELSLPLPSEDPGEKSELPTRAFIVKTRKSIYRFGEADKNGGRTVSRDNEPLDFTRCKIKLLTVGIGMELECLDGTHSNWYTTRVQSIE